MADSTPFIAISSVNDALFVVIRQQIGNQISEIAVNEAQFSGLMYTMKAIERQFIEDRTRREINNVVEEALWLHTPTEAYNPTKPAIDAKADDLKRKKAKVSKTPKLSENVSQPVL